MYLFAIGYNIIFQEKIILYKVFSYLLSKLFTTLKHLPFLIKSERLKLKMYQ